MAFVSGFGGAPVAGARSCSSVSVAPRTVRTSNISMMAKSKSVPFAECPPALTGYAGNQEFDPLNITGYLDIKWLRESELKHGRITMLACVGWLVQEVYHFDFYTALGASSNAIDTHAALSGFNKPLGQIALWVIFAEVMTTPAIVQMITGESKREAGDFGFDPLGFGKDKWAEAELVNSRLSMCAIGGFIHQGWLTGKPAIAQLTQGPWLPM